jgi:hypothetical protein
LGFEFRKSSGEIGEQDLNELLPLGKWLEGSDQQPSLGRRDPFERAHRDSEVLGSDRGWLFRIECLAVGGAGQPCRHANGQRCTRTTEIACAFDHLPRLIV